MIDEFCELIPCGVIIFDRAGQILGINKLLRELLGYSAKELEAKRVEFIFTMATKIFHQTHFLPMLKLQPKVDEIYFTLRRKDGIPVPVLANASIQDFQGQEVVVCAMITVLQRGKYEDEILAAKKQAEQALESNQELQVAKHELEQHAQQLDRHLTLQKRRNREFRKFQQIFSHDLKEPVRRIHTFTDFLLTESSMQLPEDGKLALKKIEMASARISDLLRILQDFLSADETSEELEMVDLNRSVKAAEKKLKDKCVTLVDLSINMANLPTIEGYRVQLMTLFEILLRNSIAQVGGNKVSVFMESKIIQENAFKAVAGRYRYVDFVQITYRDNGPGYHLEGQQDIFELIRHSTAASVDASLAICQRLVENHGGSMRLECSSGFPWSIQIMLPIKNWETSPITTKP